MNELDAAIKKAREGWSEERKQLERKIEALSAARGEKVTSWGATNLQSDGKSKGDGLIITLSPQHADAVWATTRPTDQDGEPLSVAHYPSAIVSDLITGKVYRVQREVCGGGCMCGVSAVELDKESTARFRKQQAQAAKAAVALGLPADSLGRSVRDGNSFGTAYIITGFENGAVVARREDGKEYLFSPAVVLAAWAATKAADEELQRRVAAQPAAATK